jgi:hypothetical protein
VSATQRDEVARAEPHPDEVRLEPGRALVGGGQAVLGRRLGGVSPPQPDADGGTATLRHRRRPADGHEVGPGQLRVDLLGCREQVDAHAAPALVLRPRHLRQQVDGAVGAARVGLDVVGAGVMEGEAQVGRGVLDGYLRAQVLAHLSFKGLVDHFGHRGPPESLAGIVASLHAAVCEERVT